MKSIVLGLLLLIWMMLSVALALSFIGLVLMLCDDSNTWMNIGNNILHGITG